MGRWLRSRCGGWVGFSAAVTVAAVLAIARLPGETGRSDLATILVERSDFLIAHFEAGEIRAAKDEKVISPRVHAQLKIIHLWPEGERVAVGDLILQFDRAEFADMVKDEASELEKARADLEQGLANQEQKRAELEMGIEQKRASVELAKINLQKAEYTSALEKEERQLILEQAERAVKQAQESFEGQKIINRVERANLELHISHYEKRYDKALKDYDRLSVYASKPGIIVYERIRKRGTDRWGKVTKGDVVWGGKSLLSLPDLSTMQVVSQVGEMDVTRVQVGQKALIRLEAFPGPIFHGEVSAVAPMAHEQEDAANIHVFEMVVDIEEQDERLYPGMSASIEIILETIPGVITIPLSAVRGEETPMVYKSIGDRFEPVNVDLGRQNGVSAVVNSGLREGDIIALEAVSLP